MIYLDANVILRYLLGDVALQSQQARDWIDGTEVFELTPEVTAEVVYVLEKVYKVPRFDLSIQLQRLFSRDQWTGRAKPLLLRALQIYQAPGVDFVDAWLSVLGSQEGNEVRTFDKKLKTLLK